EVALNHPGRDRERGRIWRISYQGPNNDQKLRPLPDLTKLTIPQLLESIGDSNLSVRIQATNQLTERDKDKVKEAVLALQQPQAKSKPEQRMHGLWVLERIGALPDALLTAAAKDENNAVRVHTQRILAERKDLPGPLHDLVVAGLKDSDGCVQRCAADALGQHPDSKNIRPLLDVLPKVPADDPQLRHTVRMALRNQLRPGENWKQLPANLSEADARAIADVAPGIHTPEAGAYLIRFIQKSQENSGTLGRYVRHAARYAPEEQQA